MEDDGEEEGSVAAGGEEDSLSEGSGISDAEDDADAEGSDGSDTGSLAPQATSAVAVANGYGGKPSDPGPQSTAVSSKPPLTATMDDTEAMMNGLRFSGEVEDEGTNFEDLGDQTEPLASQDAQALNHAESTTTDSLGERRRREHEDYKKKRDADPAFVPNRGGFFMHDHRSAAPGQNGFRPFGKGRGRGRGVMGPFPSSGYAPKDH